MVFVRHISDETRALIRFLKMENKYSLPEITKKVKISKSSAARCLKTPNITRKNKRTANVGRPKRFSVRDRQLFKRSIDQLRQVNANFTMKELIRYVQGTSMFRRIQWHEFKARVKKKLYYKGQLVTFNNFLLIMPKRIRAVIKCKGLGTKY